MNARTLTIVAGAGAAGLAAVVATGIALSGGPDCYECLVEAPCALAKRFALDAGELDCEPGERVTARVEICVDAADAGPLAELPASAGVVALGDSCRPIERGAARRPDTRVTSTRGGCWVGHWIRGDAGWDGRFAASVCCGADCRCPSGRCARDTGQHLAGTEDTHVRRALCRALDGGHPVCVTDGGVR